MNLEALQLRRADESLARGAWRIKDRDERHMPKPPPECEACGAEFVAWNEGQRVCHACTEKGYRSTPCTRCGGITHVRDRASKRMGHLYGACGRCRSAERLQRELM